jgi:hypothetical protein
VLPGEQQTKKEVTGVVYASAANAVDDLYLQDRNPWENSFRAREVDLANGAEQFGPAEITVINRIAKWNIGIFLEEPKTVLNTA